jgi:hypothetical protein
MIVVGKELIIDFQLEIYGMDEPIEVEFKYSRTNLSIPIYLSLPSNHHSL